MGKKRTKVFGHYILIDVIRWMGKEGWSAHEALRALTNLDIPVAMGTIKRQLVVGKVEGARISIRSSHVEQLKAARNSEPSSTAKENSPVITTATKPLRVPGATFPYRHQLREIGCKWVKENGNKGWFAPTMEIWNRACNIVGHPATDPSADLLNTLGAEQPEPTIHSTIDNERLSMLSDKIEELEGQIAEMKETAGRMCKTLEIKTGDGKVVKLKDVVLPKTFERVLALANARRNILLVGPAGCGKTHLGELIAKSLGLEFGSVSCTSGMSESHLLGRSVPNVTTGKNKFQSTQFLEMYENGGVFLLDELDAADPNLLLAINSAIANNYCNVPNRPEAPVAKRHKNFVLIATANTFGRGATRMYAGRNQLDEATLDRFRIGTVECSYDEAVELFLCPDDELRTHLQTIRQRIEANKLRRIMSTRFIADAYVMQQTANWTIETIVQVFTDGWTEDEKVKIR